MCEVQGSSSNTTKKKEVLFSLVIVNIHIAEGSASKILTM